MHRDVTNASTSSSHTGPVARTTNDIPSITTPDSEAVTMVTVLRLYRSPSTPRYGPRMNGGSQRIAEAAATHAVDPVRS